MTILGAKQLTELSIKIPSEGICLYHRPANHTCSLISLIIQKKNGIVIDINVAIKNTARETPKVSRRRGQSRLPDKNRLYL